MATDSEYDTLVGTIVGAHGVQGSLKVRVATPRALAMIAPPARGSDKAPRPTVKVWLGKSPDEGAEREVVSAKRPAPKSPVIVRIVGIDDRNGAQAVYGQSIYAPASRRSPLEEGEFFVDDLVGLAARTDSGIALGAITEVIAGPANDVYETELGVLIPAVKDYVLNIDLTARTMTVRDDPGLWPLPPSDRDRHAGRGHRGQPVGGDRAPEA